MIFKQFYDSLLLVSDNIESTCHKNRGKKSYLKIVHVTILLPLHKQKW